LAVLAIVVLTVTAGAAVASDLDASAGGDHGGSGQRGADRERADQGHAHDHAAEATDAGSDVDASDGTQVDGTQVDGTQVDVVESSVDVAIADSSSGPSSTSSDGSGGVPGSGAGTPSAPAEAPAAAASGPAPDAAAAAPDSTADTHTFVAAPVPGTLFGAVSDGFAAVVADAAPFAPASGFEALGEPPMLDSTGSITAIAAEVTGAPSAARTLVSTDRGRPLAAIGGLLAAIALFVGVHRRADWGDRKLAAARSGPEVARFR